MNVSLPAPVDNSAIWGHLSLYITLAMIVSIVVVIAATWKLTSIRLDRKTPLTKKERVKSIVCAALIAASVATVATSAFAANSRTSQSNENVTAAQQQVVKYFASYGAKVETDSAKIPVEAGQKGGVALSAPGYTFNCELDSTDKKSIKTLCNVPKQADVSFDQLVGATQ